MLCELASLTRNHYVVQHVLLLFSMSVFWLTLYYRVFSRETTYEIVKYIRRGTETRRIKTRRNLSLLRFRLPLWHGVFSLNIQIMNCERFNKKRKYMSREMNKIYKFVHTCRLKLFLR